MSKSVVDAHSELFHYTTLGGLHGILTSQQLWATHASYLNDIEEINGFFDRKFSRLLDRCVRDAIKQRAGSPGELRLIEQCGGEEAVIAELMRDLPRVFKDFTLGFNQPYIASFCTAVNDRIRQDGLLSQWRGYGGDGGYAIVFDTAKLQQMLELEQEMYYYQSMRWGDVNYYDHDAHINSAHDDMQELESALERALEEFIVTNDQKALDPTFDSITGLSTMHKHIGFSEEAEVRIVAVPVHPEVWQEAQRSGETRQKKRIRFLQRGGLLVPYISLFDDPAKYGNSKLPIKRILVGPHPDKAQRRRSVEMMLEQAGIDVEITVTDIPYRGR